LKVEEIRALSEAELVKQLEAAHQELFNLRFRLSTKQLVNHREIPKVKRNIARIETIITEKKLGIKAGANGSKS
jgi:large subunit ribosomal protein L29